MNTASRPLGTKTSQRWLIRCGKPEAVRRDHRKKTGSMPRMNCGRAEKIPRSDAHPRGSEPMKRSYFSSFPMRAVLCAALLIAPGGGLLLAQQPPELPPPGQALAPDQLDDLVAPVALYPDPLVSQILVASTYPLELVQASQWLAAKPGTHGRRPDPSGTAAKLGPEHTGLSGFSGPRQALEPGHHVDNQSRQRVSESARPT